jgi:hypothetical protein
MINQENPPQPSPAYLPSGQPAPLVLSEPELISLLRLDGEDGSKDPHLTLQYYRSRGLKCIQLGKHLRFYLPDVIQFLEDQSRLTNLRKSQEFNGHTPVSSVTKSPNFRRRPA